MKYYHYECTDCEVGCDTGMNGENKGEETLNNFKNQFKIIENLYKTLPDILYKMPEAYETWFKWLKKHEGHNISVI